MSKCAGYVSFALVVFLGLHSGKASTQQSAEDAQLSQSSDPAKELIDAAAGLTVELDRLIPPPAPAPGVSALIDVGAARSTASGSLFERSRFQQEVASLQDEVSHLQVQLAEEQRKEKQWRAVVQEEERQQQETATKFAEKSKKITQFAKAAADRQASLKQQLKEAQLVSRDYAALRGARDNAVEQESLWELRAREAEARLMKSLEAEGTAEKENKRMEFQLREANETLAATKQEYQLAMQMSEDKAHGRQAQLNQELRAAEAKVRTADQRARTIDTNAHAAIQMAKERYKELQIAAAQQEKTMATELQEAQTLAQESVNKAVKQLRSPGAASRASNQA